MIRARVILIRARTPIGQPECATRIYERFIMIMLCVSSDDEQRNTHGIYSARGFSLSLDAER
jgi:hypothetical protein